MDVSLNGCFFLVLLNVAQETESRACAFGVWIVFSRSQVKFQSSFTVIIEINVTDCLGFTTALG